MQSMGCKAFAIINCDNVTVNNTHKGTGPGAGVTAVIDTGFRRRVFRGRCLRSRRSRLWTEWGEWHAESPVATSNPGDVLKTLIVN